MLGKNETFRSLMNKSLRTRRGILSMVIMLALWQFIADFVVKSPLFLAGPSDVFKAFDATMREGTLTVDLLVSLEEFAIGFGLAVMVGIAAGLMIGISRRLEHYSDPIISASYATPLIALAPLFILWFGIGIWSKVAVVFLVAVFPITINVAAGVRATDRDLQEVGRAFAASRAQFFQYILLPACIPFMTSGIRLGIGRGLMGVVVGELFGARAGVGYMITQASAVFDTARIFLGVLIFMILGVVMMGAVSMFERVVTPWNQ